MNYSFYINKNMNLYKWWTNWVNLRATERYSKGVVPLVGYGYPPHTAKKSSSCTLFTGVVMVELIFGCCKNWKRAKYFLLRFSFLKRDFSMPQSNISSTKILKWCFLHIPYQKHDTQNSFCFSLFVLVTEKPCVDPNRHRFWDGMNLGRGVYVGFSEARDNS